MKKLLLPLCLLFGFWGEVNAQCNTTATASSVNIQCGQSVTLTHGGSAVGHISFEEDFNNGSPTGWASTQTASFNNPCGPGLDGTPHYWMGNASGNPRDLVTRNLDFGPNIAPAGGTICFDLRFAIQAQASPCEGPDEPGEGVYLQYSANGGSSWTTIHYFHPNGGYDPQLTNWNNYCFPMPPGALMNGVKFRWHQDAVTGKHYDHWGVDNVKIIVNDPLLRFTWLHDGYTTNAPGSNPTAVSPSTTTTYTVQMITSTDTCYQSVTVNVGPPPSVNPISNIQVCNGASVNSVNITSNPSANVTYTWSNDNPAIGAQANGTGSTIPSFTAANTSSSPQSGTYTIIPTLNNTCQGPPATFTITVNGIPEMNEPADISLCHGDPQGNIFFSSNLQNVVYTWSNTNTSIGVPANGSGLVSGFTANNTSGSPVISTIRITPSVGSCNGTPVDFTITVNPLPNVDAGPDVTVCENAEIQLNGSGAQTYIWNNGVTNNVPFSAGSSSVTYTVTGTDINGCTKRDSLIVSINPLPVIIIPQDYAICIGDTTSLTATGAVSYSWDNNIQNGVDFIPSETKTYTVTGTDANNCSSSKQVIITVNPLPDIFAGQDISICFGTPYLYSATGGVTYNWSNGAVNNQTGLLPLGQHVLQVIATDANGCVNQDEVVITVVPEPIPEFTADPTEIYQNSSINFTNNSQLSTGYSWNFGNGETAVNYSTAGIFNITYPIPGTYNVVLTATNGVCEKSVSHPVVVLPYPDPEIFIPNVFTPNGDDANDTWAIDVTFGKDIEVIILNRWGDLMTTLKDFTTRWDGKSKSGADATEGVYFYKYIIKGLNEKTYTGHGHVTLDR